MWEEYSDAKQYDAVFNDLMQECKHNAPGARLSARLRTALERMRPADRRALCSRTRDGCAPLFVACRRGNIELVEYLVHVCDADLEQRGLYEVPHDRSTHSVTPLWCAAVSGRLEVLFALADAGADVDAGSDSGSTPVRSACFMTHLDVVRVLVDRGADIHRANHNGGTCLINAVQSVPLCALLLSRGADVDACDMQQKTALHYAIQEHRLETAQLLLDHGASPYLRSSCGDDALRTACLKGAERVAAVLLSMVPYSPETAADAHELLGATQLDEFNDVAAALDSWRLATAFRYGRDGYVPKRWAVPGDVAAATAVLGVEWHAAEELEAMAEDVEALRMQSLLIAARVLGVMHKDTVYRLMYRGAAYADALQHQSCYDMWSWALQIRIANDSLLSSDTCHSLSAVTRMMLDAISRRLHRAAGVPRHADVVHVFQLVVDHLPAARTALALRPVHKKQAETYDRTLRCASHLVHLLLVTASGPREMAAVEKHVRRLVGLDVRSAHTGDTLLHLCVSRLNVVRSTYFADEITVPVFPSVAVVSLLLRCGADPLVRNEARSTALHVAAIPYNFSSELVSALLAGGAHLDQPNKFGDSAGELVALNRDSRIKPLQHTSLTCLAARAVVASKRSVLPESLPRTLYSFLVLHRA